MRENGMAIISQKELMKWRAVELRKLLKQNISLDKLTDPDTGGPSELRIDLERGTGYTIGLYLLVLYS